MAVAVVVVSEAVAEAPPVAVDEVVGTVEVVVVEEADVAVDGADVVEEDDLQL